MRSIYAKDYQDIPRPVAAMMRDYTPGSGGRRHSHRRAQLLHAISGTMLVLVDGGSWILPPHRALWIPAGIDHEVHCRGHVALRTVYIEPDACEILGTTCKALTVSNLLTELLVEAARIPLEYDLDSRDGRLMQLLLDEIARMESLPLDVPMPQSSALLRLCGDIMRRPGELATLDDCAALTGMTRRSFTRRFRNETGISFLQWHVQVRLREALAKLNEGQPVTTVALDVGYDSPSAFTAAFRRHFNLLPSQVPVLGLRTRADS
jgi:AraC-like DNA-binding protein